MAEMFLSARTRPETQTPLFPLVNSASPRSAPGPHSVEQDGHYYRHLAMIFPSRSQLASQQITRTGRAGAVTKEGLAATLLQHVSPIEWDNIVLYGEYVLNRRLVRRSRSWP